MRLRVIGNILGALLLFIAAAMLLPLLISIIYQETDTFAFITSMAITLFAGICLRWGCRGESEISMKESFAIVTLGWVFAALCGGLPFVLSGVLPRPVDAFFEAMSGFTTTGASVITDVEALPHGILFWRSLTQWFGGMGIILLFVAILPRLGISGAQLFRAEVPGPNAERILPKIADTARVLWYIYIGITVLEAVLLCLAGMNLFDALIHTFSSVATGGFSDRNMSIAAYDSLAIEGIITLFLFLCGVNFALYFQLIKGNNRNLLRDPELRFYLLVVLGATVLIALNLLTNNVYDTIGEAVRYALFQVVSVITTTGFTTANYDLWPPFAKFILLLLMFIGACAGSTSGAMKSIRIVVLLKHAYREIVKIIHPRAVVPLRVGGKTVPDEIVASILGFAFLYLFIFIVCALVVMALGLDLISGISVAAATLGNIGTGLGVVGPATNFAALNDLTTFILTLCMLLGRLEIYTVLVFILPEFRQIRHLKHAGRNVYASVRRSIGK